METQVREVARDLPAKERPAGLQPGQPDFRSLSLNDCALGSQG